MHDWDELQLMTCVDGYLQLTFSAKETKVHPAAASDFSCLILASIAARCGSKRRLSIVRDSHALSWNITTSCPTEGDLVMLCRGDESCFEGLKSPVLNNLACIQQAIHMDMCWYVCIEITHRHAIAPCPMFRVSPSTSKMAGS